MFLVNTNPSLVLNQIKSNQPTMELALIVNHLFKFKLIVIDFTEYHFLLHIMNVKIISFIVIYILIWDLYGCYVLPYSIQYK